MLISITAYPVFGSLSVLAQVHETSATGRNYTRLIQECPEIPQALSEGSAWDLMWLLHRNIGDHLEHLGYGPQSSPDASYVR